MNTAERKRAWDYRDSGLLAYSFLKPVPISSADPRVMCIRCNNYLSGKH